MKALFDKVRYILKIGQKEVSWFKMLIS
jgi:hypothetical protein